MKMKSKVLQKRRNFGFFIFIARINLSLKWPGAWFYYTQHMIINSVPNQTPRVIFERRAQLRVAESL
jgi:hypothetical protein